MVINFQPNAKPNFPSLRDAFNENSNLYDTILNSGRKHILRRFNYPTRSKCYVFCMAYDQTIVKVFMLLHDTQKHAHFVCKFNYELMRNCLYLHIHFGVIFNILTSNNCLTTFI